MIFKRTESGVDFRFSGSGHILGGCTSDFRRAQRAGIFGGVVFINKHRGGRICMRNDVCDLFIYHISYSVSVSESVSSKVADTLGIRFSPRCKPADK